LAFPYRHDLFGYIQDLRESLLSCFTLADIVAEVNDKTAVKA
jgi:hypothetical protein